MCLQTKWIDHSSDEARKEATIQKLLYEFGLPLPEIYDKLVDGLEEIVCLMYGFTRVKQVNAVWDLMLK